MSNKIHNHMAALKLLNKFLDKEDIKTSQVVEIIMKMPNHLQTIGRPRSTYYIKVGLKSDREIKWISKEEFYMRVAIMAKAHTIYNKLTGYSL